MNIEEKIQKFDEHSLIPINKKFEILEKLFIHPFLGTLPRQQYFGKKVKWYNPELGCCLSGFVESVAAVIYFSATHDYVAAPFFFEGLFRFTNEGKPYGVAFLEIPYRLGEKIYKILDRKIKK